MTSCSNARENISAYIDDELNINERISFEEHIKNCKECKAELEEILKIVELCKELPQQELPVDFKSELHEKLLAVAIRQDVKVRSIRKSKSFFFTKTFASIAAGMLLIFLAGSFYKFGLLSPMKSEDSINNTAMAAEQPAAREMGEASDMVRAGGQAENAGAAESKLKGFSASAAADTEGLVIDRSGTVQERESACTDALQMQDVETASNKVSTITITANDPEALAEKVKSLAMENGGEVKDNSANSDGDLTLSYSGMMKTDEAAVSGKAAYVLSQDRIDFVVPEAQYSHFIADINTAFGEANVQAGAFVTEDRTEILNSSITRTNEIDNQIQELQGKESEKDSTEINNLKAEKITIDSQIEEIRLGTDFVNVTVFINKK